MAISQTQAENFVNRTKTDYLSLMTSVRIVQMLAVQNALEVTAWGGAAAITAAIPDLDWDATYPFTKAEFADILNNFGDADDVLGAHGDLKTNLTKLRE
jgi:hypothetical protein